MAARSYQPPATQPKPTHLTLSSAPPKRKYSNISDDSDEPQPLATARLHLQDPSSQDMSDSTRQYGVYMHNLLSDSTGAESKLVTTATDWNSAYEAMRTHASHEIDAHPIWGATKELVTNNVYEIIDRRHVVRLRYDIDTIRSVGKDAEDTTIWEREQVQNYVDAPPVHYGMYIDMNSDNESKKEQYFVGGYRSLGEASHAMKTSAYAYLEKHSGVKLMERSVELMDEKGEIRQRYVIEKGRRERNVFVKEEDWLNKEMDIGVGNTSFSTPDASENVDIKKPILRLAPPHTSASPIPQAAAPQAQQPEPEPEYPAEVTQESWCTCRQPDDGSLMLLCENEDCPIQWYHSRCVGIVQEPGEKDKWWCPQCAPTHARKAPVMKAKSRKKRKRN